jgi:ketosteroid isomerase-like protein
LYAEGVVRFLVKGKEKHMSSPIRMPSKVATYFAATNARDLDRMIAAFANDAVVKDEGREHHGLGAIRKWMEQAIEKYAFEVEPTEVDDTEGRTVVTATVSGSFPGSPVHLRHAFTIDHREQIARLEIQ